MAYALYTQSFGALNANLPVVIRDTVGTPAIILAATTGGVINHQGKATLNGSGNLSVIIDTAITWTVTVSVSQTGGTAIYPRIVFTGPFASFPDPTKFSVGSIAVATDQTNAEYNCNGVSWIAAGGVSGITTLASATDYATANLATGNASLSTALTTKLPYLGIQATISALQTAFPAVSNNGASALVGSSAPYQVYQSNGSTWVATASLTTIQQAAGAAGTQVTYPGYFPNSGGVHSEAPAQIARARYGRAPSATGVSGAKLSLRQAYRLPMNIVGFRFGFESNESAAVTYSKFLHAVVGAGLSDTNTTAMDAVANFKTANTCTASISTTVMTVTAKLTGRMDVGQQIFGTSVTAGTTIVNQLTSTESGGALGGAGTYTVLPSQTVASTTISGFGVPTFSNGSAGVTLPAQSVADTAIPVVWSDWIPLTASKGYVLVIEALLSASGTYTYYATSMSTFATLLATMAYPVGCWSDTIDRLASPTATWGTTSANANGNNFISHIEFITDGAIPSLSVLSIGDSTTLGTSNPDGANLPQIQMACETLSNNSVYLSPICRGWSGKTTKQYYNYLVQALTDQRPHIVHWLIGSQNNFTSDWSYERAILADVVDRCIKLGMVIIVRTAIPMNGSTILFDNARKGVNTFARTLPGVIIDDADAVLTDGASPASYSRTPTDYGTGQHPASQGNIDMTTRLIPALRTAVSRYGFTV